MMPDVGTYTSLIQSVGEVLKAENDNEAQWFALPVVLVAGCKRTNPAAYAAYRSTLRLPANYPNLRTPRKTRNGCLTSSTHRLEQRYPGRVVPSQAKR